MPPGHPPPSRLIALFQHSRASLLVLSRLPAVTTGTGIRFCSSLSSTSASSSPHSFLPFLNHDHSAADYDPDAVAASLKDWFKKPTSLLDHIYDLLAFTDSAKDLDAALSSLRLPLSESFVHRVLHHRPRLAPSSADEAIHTSASTVKDDFLVLRIKFFDWAGRQRHYNHTRAAYHTVFKLLAKANRASTILDWLAVFSTTTRQGPTFLQYPTLRFNDTLVIGYCVAGRSDAALRVFSRMRFRGLDLDSFGYHVIFNALVEARAFDVADSMCRQITERGHSGPITSFIHVKSLCKRGMLDQAKDVLVLELGPYARPLPPRGRYSGPATLDGAVAFLVEALCKRRRFDEAERLIHEFGGSRSYIAWFNNHINALRVNVAIGFLRDKRDSEGYVPEVSVYNKLIHHLLFQNRLEEFYDFLMEMRDGGVKPDRGTINATLCFLCKAGMVDVAIHLYDSRLEIGLILDSMAVDHLINAFCGEKEADMACAILEASMKHGYFPGKQTFNLLAKFLCSVGRLDKMDELLDAAIERNIIPVNKAYGRYVSTLCKGGKIEDGYMVLTNRSGIPLTSHAYVRLIYGFICLKRHDMLCRLLWEMQENGHVPGRRLFQDVIACLCQTESHESHRLVFNLLRLQLSRRELDHRTCYNYFINALGNAKQPEIALEVFKMMVNDGISINRQSQILMLLCLMKSGRIGDALSYFNDMNKGLETSTQMYNVLITSLCKADKPDQAYFVWKEVREKCLTPNLHCYETLIKVLCSHEDYPKAVTVIEDFDKTGRPLCPYICNVILYHTLRNSELVKAWIQHDNDSEVIRDLAATEKDASIPQRPSLRQLAFAFSGGIRIRDSLDTLDETFAELFPVNLYTYNMLLCALAQSGKMNYACNTFDRMCRKGYVPNRWTYDFIVSGFCMNKQKKDAEIWIKKMYRNGYFPTQKTQTLFNRISKNE